MSLKPQHPRRRLLAPPLGRIHGSERFGAAASPGAGDRGASNESLAMGLPDNNGRLFVGGVAPGTGDEDLRRHFCRYGEVTDVCQPKDRLNGLPRGFAFVQFPRPADAGRALADPHHVINGEQVYKHFV